jgi:hypothetical protein
VEWTESIIPNFRFHDAVIELPLPRHCQNHLSQVPR